MKTKSKRKLFDHLYDINRGVQSSVIGACSALLLVFVANGLIAHQWGWELFWIASIGMGAGFLSLHFLGKLFDNKANALLAKEVSEKYRVKEPIKLTTTEVEYNQAMEEVETFLNPLDQNETRNH